MSGMHDLISRQAAIDFKVTKGANIDGVLYVPYCEVKKFIESLPSAQPKTTKEDVELYCKQRCLIVVTSEFYDEMMSRWSSAQSDVLSHLIDRPCAVCEYHTESGCSQWKCVFERRHDGRPYKQTGGD